MKNKTFISTIRNFTVAAAAGLGVTLIAAVTPSEKRPIFLAGSIVTVCSLAAIQAKQAKDSIDAYKKTTNRTKLEIAFDHLFTNQGGLVTLEQLRASAKVSIQEAAEFLQEQLAQHGANAVQGFGPNAFLFTNHPMPLIEQLEKNIIDNLTAQQAAVVQQQPQPQQYPPQQYPPQQPQVNDFDIEKILSVIQSQQAELSRQAWAANNNVPQPNMPQAPVNPSQFA